MSRLKTNHYLDIEIGEDELQEIEFNKKATYEEVKEYVLEKNGLKVSNLYIAQIKTKHGLKERLNYDKSKKSSNRSLICPEVKEKEIEDVFKYFGMI